MDGRDNGPATTKDVEDAMITGRCLCGSVRYTIDAQPIMARVCWCRLCQYIGAGTGTANVMFPSAALKVEGEVTVYSSVADSGNHMHRRFCSKCGTPVSTTGDRRPDIVGVRGGTLDDPEIARPQSTIWVSEAPSGVHPGRSSQVRGPAASTSTGQVSRGQEST
jgi:hypothetical protein